MTNTTLQPLTYDHDFSGMIHITRNGQHVAHMEKHNNEQAERQTAYARAFVAAPDLLAALKTLLAMYDTGEMVVPIHAHFKIDAARRAFRKATAA